MREIKEMPGISIGGQINNLHYFDDTNIKQGNLQEKS
jgi:hypothetical protein